jgi:membrane-associated phospholipid phosphatase
LKKDLFAKYYSYLFVPTTFTLWLFIYSSLTFLENKFLGIILSVLFTFIIPIAVFLMFKKHGKIKDYDASVKEERTNLYFIGVLLCGVGLIISIALNFNINYSILWLIYIINSLFLIMINKYWKISAHMIGVSAPMAAFLFFGSIYFIILFFLAILLAWARLKLKMHSINQIIAGFLFGFLLTYLQLIIFIG